MSAGNTGDTQNLVFWFDGQVSANLQRPSTVLANFSFWFDGETYATVYPAATTTNLNGGFFFFM